MGGGVTAWSSTSSTTGSSWPRRVPGAEDFKTRLQEVVLRRIGELPRYEVEGTGPDHARRYRARVLVAGAERGVGEGRSKKDAEQAAARVAWAVLVDDQSRQREVTGPKVPISDVRGSRSARASSEGCGAVPELPEVETIRRDLDKEVVTRRIKTVEVKGKRSIRRHKSGPEFKTRLEGKRVASIRRAGKYLLLGLDGDDVLVVHLGMSGQLLRAKGPKDPLDKHTHVIITFTQGGQLRFVDPRTFGEMFVTSTDELTAQVPELAHLGLRPARGRHELVALRATAGGSAHRAQDAAHGPEVRGRHRQHLLRRDPLRGRACATTASRTH